MSSSIVGDASLIDRLSSEWRRLPPGLGGRCGGRSGRHPARLCLRAGTIGGVLKERKSSFQVCVAIKRHDKRLQF